MKTDDLTTKSAAVWSYRAYANLVEWFPLASICDSKSVSHVCCCLNNNNRKSDFSKLCIKSDG